MNLTTDEQTILDGKQGEILQKVMRSVMVYGDIFGAERLVPVEGAPHLVTSFGANTIQPYFEMLDVMINAGLKAQKPFTVDPRPMEYETLNPTLIQRLAFKFIFGKQVDYEKQLSKLGLKNSNAFSCACYLPEVGNIPTRGMVLAWSESSAVVYANSVIGARTNRNSAGIDLMCSILGKVPMYGLLTDEGRQATWKVEIKTTRLPNAQLLGSAVGLQVMEAVPYLTGLDAFLGAGLNLATEAYLKDLGAAAASNGAVGLYHIEGITPEAADQGQALLKPGYHTYVIDDAELERVMQSYPLLWKDPQARPRRIFIGCPHLTHQQIEQWVGRIDQALHTVGQTRVSMPVYLCTAPDIADQFKLDAPFYRKMLAQDVHLTTICPLMYMNNPLCARDPIVTNSNKLRTYSTARFFLDDDVLHIAVTGSLPQGGTNG